MNNIIVTMPTRDVLLRHSCKTWLPVRIRGCTLLSLMYSWPGLFIAEHDPRMQVMADLSSENVTDARHSQFLYTCVHLLSSLTIIINHANHDILQK